MQASSLREKKLESLLNATQILNSSQNTDQILKSLLELSINLIDGGDTGCIFLYNKLSGLLEMYAYVGMGDAVKNVKLQPGESMTGLAFVKEKAIFFSNPDTAKKSMRSLSEKNTELAIAANVDPLNIHSSICCPLLYKDHALGVLVIDNFKDNAPLTENDVDLLKAISVQATIAIINALNLEKELQHIHKLEEYNKTIENQKNLYKYSIQMHGKFTNLVLNGSSLNDIISEVKALSGKDVFLIDLFYNIAKHTFGKELPQEFFNLRPIAIDNLKKYQQSTFYDSNSDMYFFSFPIMVNQEAMGWLCLTGKTMPLTENEIIIAERSITILAIEILKQNELTNLEQSLKGDFLDSLLSGSKTDYLLKYSANYQFNIYSSHRILLIKFIFNPSTSQKNDKSEKHIRDCLKRYYQPFNEELRMHFPGSLALVRRHYIVCILESDISGKDKQIESVLDMIKRKFHQNYSREYKNLQIRIGVSNTFDNIKDFKETFNNTLNTVKMIENTNIPIEILFFKDIEIKRLLLANKDKDLEQFYNKLLSPLLEYENNSKKDFLKTLEVYLKTNCNYSASKDLLHIHGNTLTYRLNRISEILGIDLKNYQDRLRLQIAFEIKDLLQ